MDAMNEKIDRLDSLTDEEMEEEIRAAVEAAYAERRRRESAPFVVKVIAGAILAMLVIGLLILCVANFLTAGTPTR
jgi:hypothetical protein